jgi:hypothetical protein
MDDSPAFKTFTTALMHLARAIETIVHAKAIGESIEVDLQVATLDHALHQLAPPEHLAACALLAGLEQRLASAGDLPSIIDPCVRYLQRFGRAVAVT